MLWLAGNPRAEGLVRQLPISQPLVDRFVAGEEVEDALTTATALNHRGLHYTLDLLGENAANSDQAIAAGRTYVALLDRIQAANLPGNISIKLTMLGLDTSDELAWENLVAIVHRASELDMFVRVDMEGSPYTERTLALFRKAHDLYPDSVGIVLQSYLYRTDSDLEEMIARRARVRIVKGAYKEPETVAYPHKSDVDTAFRRHIERLLDAGNYPAIATHDEAIIRMTKGYALRMGIDRSRFEFQMLYGIRRERQVELAAEGYNMRVYVPYGTSWYPYFMRRLAERPANVLFVLRQLFRG
jgi:proline dehydrogenase